jgi:phosphatidylserine/phosphatidylglycerophosphate/cardiolipin synthase-like enzyme
LGRNNKRKRVALAMDDQAGGYSGSESYKYVDPILYSKAHELLVISPYIGMGYAKRLVAIGRKKKVMVVTSTYSQPVANYIRHHSRYLLYGYLKALVLLVVGALIAVYFSFYLIAVAALGMDLLFGLAALLSYKLSKNSKIEIRTSYDKFVHEKAYISDAIAAVGSANLTYNGMHKNVERVEVITDHSRIAHLRTHFLDLWKTCR